MVDLDEDQYINMSYHIHQPKWPSLVITFFLILEITSFLFEDRAIFELALGGISLLVLLLQFKYIFNRWNVWLLTFLAVAITSFVFMYLFQHRVTTIQVRLLMHFSMLMLIIRYGVRIRFIELLLWGYILLMSYIIFFTPVRIRDIFPSASENFVGWVALVLGVFYYLLVRHQDEKKKILPALGILAFAIICVGRGTILAAMLLTFAVLFSRFYNGSAYHKFFFFSAFAFIMTGFFMYEGWQTLILEGFRKFQEKGFSMDHRDMLIAGYFEKITPASFFAGVNPSQPPFTNYNENFHNSYLLAHSNFGIWAIIGFVFLIILMLRGLKNNIFTVLMLLVFLARIFTDSLAFVGYFDFIFFYGAYVLRSLIKANNVKVNSA